VQDNLIQAMANCYDVIGILLVIHIARISQDAMRSRSIMCLDSYYDSVLTICWGRFTSVCALHAESLSTADPLKLGSIDTRPHYVRSRGALPFATYTSAPTSPN